MTARVAGAARRANALRAGVAYALIVFAAGFCLGALRTLALAPRIGPTLAVLLETPIILAVSWIVARWCTRRFGVGATTPERAAMGVIAFVVLMGAELVMALLLFQRPFAAYLASFATASGAIGLVAQLGFAAIPWVQARVADGRARRQ